MFEKLKILWWILVERQRQINQEGFDSDHDDKNNSGEMASAAAYYAYPSHRADLWPFRWDGRWAKRSKHARLRQLIIAAALIVAEIQRLRRLGVGE